MGQIGALAHGVEGVDQDLHTRQAGARDKVPGGFVQIPQVLRDQVQAGDLPAQVVHQVLAGTGLPAALQGGGGPHGDGPVGVEAPEVVDAHRVVEQRGVFHPAHPPGKERLPVSGPVIEGVAPVLAHVGEGVGGHAGRRLGAERLVELEESGLGPHLRAVG